MQARLVPSAKRVADDVQDEVKAHGERRRRVSAEYGTAREDLNECLGCVGQLTSDFSGVTYALSRHSSDRDCHEIRYLDMTEDFQRRDEIAQIILVRTPTVTPFAEKDEIGPSKRQ